MIDCGICIVRLADDRDAAPMAALADDWEIARFLLDRFPHPYTIEHARDWIGRNSDPAATHFVIDVAGELAGGIGYVPLDGEHGLTADIGYWVGRRFWGRGIATAACRALTEWIFGETPLLRLQAEVFAPNVASQRVLEKCAYQREGVLRRNIVKNGEILNGVMYAKLRP